VCVCVCVCVCRVCGLLCIIDATITAANVGLLMTEAYRKVGSVFHHTEFEVEVTTDQLTTRIWRR
jgi:hypothetical protein